MRRFIAINDIGRRIGETHHRSTIPDEIVDAIREMHEDRGWSYQRIAMRLKLPVPTVAKICRYERRAQTADRYLWVEVKTVAMTTDSKTEM